MPLRDSRMFSQMLSQVRPPIISALIPPVKNAANASPVLQRTFVYPQNHGHTFPPPSFSPNLGKRSLSTASPQFLKNPYEIAQKLLSSPLVQDSNADMRLQLMQAMLYALDACGPFPQKGARKKSQEFLEKLLNDLSNQIYQTKTSGLTEDLRNNLKRFMRETGLNKFAIAQLFLQQELLEVFLDPDQAITVYNQTPQLKPLTHIPAQLPEEADLRNLLMENIGACIDQSPKANKSILAMRLLLRLQDPNLLKFHSELVTVYPTENGALNQTSTGFPFKKAVERLSQGCAKSETAAHVFAKQSKEIIDSFEGGDLIPLVGFLNACVMTKSRPIFSEDFFILKRWLIDKGINPDFLSHLSESDSLQLNLDQQNIMLELLGYATLKLEKAAGEDTCFTAINDMIYFANRVISVKTQSHPPIDIRPAVESHSPTPNPTGGSRPQGRGSPRF